MNVGGSIVQHVSELSFDFFSNCQGFVLIPQNVLRLLVSCVIKIKVKGTVNPFFKVYERCIETKSTVLILFKNALVLFF